MSKDILLTLLSVVVIIQGLTISSLKRRLEVIMAGMQVAVCLLQGEHPCPNQIEVKELAAEVLAEAHKKCHCRDSGM